jgi:hypothetical protein
MKQKKQRKEVNAESFYRMAVVLVVLAALLLVATLPIALTKKSDQSTIRSSGITSEQFYFTIDMLEDNDDETTRTDVYQLYASDSVIGHSVVFHVQNYFDSTRITQSEITYHVMYSSTDSDYAFSLTTDQSGVNKAVKNGDEFTMTNRNENGEIVEESQAFTLLMGKDYVDGTEVTVQIHATSPYRKILNLKFVLHTFVETVTE